MNNKYCLKFTALPSGKVWYGTGDYSRKVAEELANRFNAEMADVEVTVATVKEREKAQEDKK